MYERFTDRARKVMQLANQEAQRFNHEYIGTEHILLGLIKEGSGVAANVLRNLDIDLRKIRLEVEKLVQSGPDMVTMGKLPQTPRAKKVIEYSMEEARNLGHNYVGTEHILLGLLREQEGVAAQVLMNLGLKLEEVREEVLNLLGHGMESGEGAERGGGGGMGGQGEGQRTSKSKTPALDSFGRDLTELARQGKLDPVIGREKEIERTMQILGRPGPHQGVQLVNEEDDVPRLLDLLDHGLEALLELAAVLGAGDHPRQVQLHHPLLQQDLGDRAADDLQRQALDDGGLAHPGLADEDGIVLLAAAQHLDDPLDLRLAPDDRVQLVLAAQRGEVHAELVQGRGPRAAGLLGGLLAQQLLRLGLGRRHTHPEVPQHQRGDPLALADEAQQQVLGADVVVAQRARLGDGVLQHLLGLGGEGDLAGRRELGPHRHDLLDLGLHGRDIDVQLLQDGDGQPVALADEAQQQMLGADEVVAQPDGLLAGQDDHLPGTFRESLEHRMLLRSW